jgi:hypothetical protein
MGFVKKKSASVETFLSKEWRNRIFGTEKAKRDVPCEALFRKDPEHRAGRIELLN